MYHVCGCSLCRTCLTNPYCRLSVIGVLYLSLGNRKLYMLCLEIMNSFIQVVPFFSSKNGFSGTMYCHSYPVGLPVSLTVLLLLFKGPVWYLSFLVSRLSILGSKVSFIYFLVCDFLKFVVSSFIFYICLKTLKWLSVANVMVTE